jgi:hypothetical protein
MERQSLEDGAVSPIDLRHDGRGAYLSTICLLLCATLLAGVSDFRPAPTRSAQTPTVALHVPELDAGFNYLYESKPEEAHKQFEAREKSHPQDPLGYASEAAAFLFEECYRQGILTSEFFLNDKRFFWQNPPQTGP